MAKGSIDDQDEFGGEIMEVGPTLKMAGGMMAYPEESMFEDRQQQMTWKQKSWRFAYEALTHVHSLRLFLFNDFIMAPFRCLSLRAYLLPTSPFSASPVVVCQWRSPEGDSHSVYVPMPFCLIDHSAPFSASAHNDHIEVKLKLLPFGVSFLDGLSFLGFSHRGVPIKRDGGATEKRDEAPFSLSSDAELLSTEQGLTFYCKNCSAKLTSRPFSRVQELPSSDWRELADYWFGTCCCGNAARTKSSLAKFEKLLTPTRGLCLVGSTICVAHSADMVSGNGDQNEHGSVVNESYFDGSGNVSEEELEEAPKVPIVSGDASTCVKGSTSVDAVDDGVVDAGAGGEMTPVVIQSWVDPSTSSAEIVVGSNDDSMDIVEHGDCGTRCGGHHGEVQRGDLSDESPPPQVVNMKNWSSGFMSGPCAAFSASNWRPYNCYACSSLVGTSSEGGGVQLFKCHISTDASPGEPSNVFKYHTLERVFCDELLANAEDNSSYRYIIRGLNTKVILLQLVLLNHESWNCCGLCLGELSFPSKTNSLASLERRDSSCDLVVSSPECELMIGVGKEEFPPAFLEPVVKVMFRDTSSFSQEELSAVESWATEQQADDIYMLESEVKSLAESLLKNQKLFPESCASFQQFHFSFLAR